MIRNWIYFSSDFFFDELVDQYTPVSGSLLLTHVRSGGLPGCCASSAASAQLRHLVPGRRGGEQSLAAALRGGAQDSFQGGRPSHWLWGWVVWAGNWAGLVGWNAPYRQDTLLIDFFWSSLPTCQGVQPPYRPPEGHPGSFSKVQVSFRLFPLKNLGNFGKTFPPKCSK